MSEFDIFMMFEKYMVIAAVVIMFLSIPFVIILAVMAQGLSKHLPEEPSRAADHGIKE